MSIASNLSPVGYRALLPAGYTRIDFLGADNEAYIKTDYVPEVGCEIWCTQKIQRNSRATFGAGDTYPNFLVLVYDSGSQKGYMGFFNNKPAAQLPWNLERHTMHFKADGTITDGSNSTRVEFEGTRTGTPLYLFTRADNLSVRTTCKIYNLKIKHTRSIELVPAIDPAGLPCMYDIVTNKPFYNTGKGAFIAGVSTVGQLTALLYRLPATGGKLTLSLPAEANAPEVAEAMQACYDTKGWSITVHEYRSSTAATYSLRRVREVVWCRRVWDEFGGYVDLIGNRVRLERCAAIFGEHGSAPEEYGYTPFDSVEQAAEEWDLTPYQETETTDQETP